MNDAQNEQSFATGSVLAGKLRIIRRLGEGGMGAVFEVEHVLTHHRRALKLLHAEMAAMPAVVERFLREASAAGRIGNPHIVETFDAGLLDTGEPYIVMELLQGQSLADALIASGPLDLARASEIVIQACDAVHSAHAAGIIHRDLKPENLFLVGSGSPFVKILDFGISKFDAGKTGVEGLTMEGSPIGTPYYMSPEQIRGESDVDARTDVYALGVVLYECLTGRRPFESDNLLQLIHLVSQGVYALPSEVRALPKEVDDVIAKAMSMDRAGRYATASEFAEALGRLRKSVDPMVLKATAPAVTERPPMPEVGTMAMTPAPVSRTLGELQASSWPHRSTLRVFIAVGLGVLALVAAAVTVGPRLWNSHGGMPAAAASTADVGHFAGASAAAQGGPVALPTPSSAVTELTVPEIPSAPLPAKPRPPSAAAERKPPAAAASTRRADSYGLSKDNPFKSTQSP